MLESDMKDFSYTLPLGNSEDLFKMFYFFQNLLHFSSSSILSKNNKQKIRLENNILKAAKKKKSFHDF